MSSVRRSTFSLSVQTSDDLRKASAQLGISRSALVEQMLSAGLSDLLRVLAQIPSSGSLTSGDAKRLRGESVRVIEDRLSELGSLVTDLRVGE
jgi:hypothetical protein